MAKMFQKKKKPGRSRRPRSKKTEKAELVDPILYIGGLNNEKYPQLPLENDTKEEEEIENPLNKR